MAADELELWEGAPARPVRLPDAVLDALVGSELVDVAYRSGDAVAVAARRKVGVARVGPLVVRIHPKLPIHRVLYLVGYASDRGWRTGAVSFEAVGDLLNVVADAFLRQVEPALAEGPLQGYHEVDESLTVIRGRVREQEQVRRRFGIPLPVLVRYDEFSADIAENQILRTAATRLLRLPGLAGPVRTRLRHVDATLGAATELIPGRPLPAWRPSRLNQRFHLALWLAELVIRHASFDLPSGAVRADGFVVDMAKVFEDFVTKALGAALARHGGRCAPQRRLWLDTGRTVEIKPDLTWLVDDAPTAVIDAKYKAEKPAGFPNADVYQMLAYCTALDLGAGHLVYARGNEAEQSATIRNAGIEVRCHTLDLEQPPEALLAQIEALAATIAGQ